MHVVVAALAQLIRKCLLHQSLKPVRLQHRVRLKNLLNLLDQVLSPLFPRSLPPWSLSLQLLDVSLQRLALIHHCCRFYHFFFVVLLWTVTLQSRLNRGFNLFFICFILDLLNFNLIHRHKTIHLRRVWLFITN